MSRKALTVAVVAATIAWSIGLSALVLPLTVKAAPASGSLVKASLPAVYYIGADGKRYVFPNEKTYKTWYPDFSGVMIITDAELAGMSIGGNVTYRPGVKLVKITTDPKTYAVAKGGVLRWVKTEALATELYGSDWNTADTHDVPDAFFTNYAIGADINAASDYSPSAAMASSTTINEDKGLTGPSPVSGALTATLSANQPAGGSLPGGATGVTMLKVDVRNGSSTATTLSSLTIKRTGAGTTADFANLYVYQGETRLTTGRTLNSTSHEATFSGLNLPLAAGETKTLSIVADMAVVQGPGNTHAIQMTGVWAGTVQAAGLPLTGPTFTMSSADVGTVTITRAGSQPLPNVKAGGMNQKIAEFQLTAGSAEDIDLKKIALFRGGAVSRQYVTNLALKQAGLTIATTASYDSNDRATFLLSNPLLIEKGSTRTFEVYADIGAGSRVGAAETILTYLDQSTDLLATGRVFGYGVTVLQGAPAYDGTGGCALGVGNCSSTRVEGGQLTITFNGPAAKDIATNGKDIEVYNFTLAAQSNLEIRNLRMQISSVGAGADNDSDRGDLVDTVAGVQGDGDDVPNFTDIKVTDTAGGSIVAGPRDVVATAGHNDQVQALTYTEVITLSAGASRTFKVTLDVANNTNADFLNDQVRVDLLAFQANDVRNLDNSTYVATTDIVPNAQISGNPMTVKAPTLTVGVASTPVAQTYIQGLQGAQLAGFTLQAGDAADIRVTSLSIQGLIDDAGDGVAGGDALGQESGGGNTVANVVLTAKLWRGSTQVGDTESPSASTGVGTGGVLTFDNLNLTVSKGTTLTLTLAGNLASALNNLPDDLRFQVTAAGSVSATDPDGNTVAATAGAFPLIGPNMLIAAAGTLSVVLAPDDTESEASNVIGGSSNTVLAKFKFSAINEELKLTKVRMVVTTANTVSSLSLYDGATLVCGPTSVNGAGQADFSNCNLVIPKDGTKTLTVKGNLNTVGASGATTGTEATVTMHDGDELAGDDGTFEARGTSSGSSTLITAADATDDNTPAGDIAGRQKVMRRTKPTVSLVALPTTALNNSTLVAMRFTVSADAAGDVSLMRLSASLTSSAAGTVTFLQDAASSVRRVGDGSNLAGSADINGGAACTGGLTCAIRAQFTNEEVIAAGTSRTYDLRITVGGTAVVAGNTMSTNLTGDTLLSTGELHQITAAPGLGLDALAPSPDNDGEFNLIWSDMSASGHGNVISAGAANDVDNVAAGATNDWTNALHVKVLPSDSQTLTRS